MSGGCAGSRRKATPRSITFQPAASISPRSRSAAGQFFASRAAVLALAAAWTSAGMSAAGEAREPVALLVPGQVGHDPGDGVHRLEALQAVFLGHAPERALPLRPGETQLLDEGMRHGRMVVRRLRPRSCRAGGRTRRPRP